MSKKNAPRNRPARQVAECIYLRYGKFYYRTYQPNGKRTFRKIDAVSLKAAKAKYHELKAAENSGEALATKATVGTILNDYLRANCPDRKRQPREGTQLDQEKNRVAHLLKWWEQ